MQLRHMQETKVSMVPTPRSHATAPCAPASRAQPSTQTPPRPSRPLQQQASKNANADDYSMLEEQKKLLLSQASAETTLKVLDPHVALVNSARKTYKEAFAQHLHAELVVRRGYLTGPRAGTDAAGDLVLGELQRLARHAVCGARVLQAVDVRVLRARQVCEVLQQRRELVHQDRVGVVGGCSEVGQQRTLLGQVDGLSRGSYPGKADQRG
jgi:hypothetical protein